MMAARTGWLVARYDTANNQPDADWQQAAAERDVCSTWAIC